MKELFKGCVLIVIAGAALYGCLLGMSRLGWIGSGPSDALRGLLHEARSLLPS